MSALLTAFRANWAAFRIPAEKRVLLALSGGLDSMVLAHLLLQCRIPFSIAHCNFGLRAGESLQDEIFVRNWAGEHHLTAHIRRFDVGSQPAGESTQMIARRLRYAWFAELLEMHRYGAILTAHHADDQAETLLINLARGTGIAGLQGIPQRNGDVLRPLLFAGREAIRSYATENAIAWREDASNASDKYLRNAIRHQVIPALESLLPGATGRIAATAGRVAGSMPIYQSALNDIMKRLIERRGRDLYVPVRLLRKQAQLDTLIYELFQPYGFSGEQVAQIRALMESGSGRQMISGTHRIVRDRDFLIVTAVHSTAADLIKIESFPAVVPCAAGELHFRIIAPPAELPDDPNLALLDADRIELPLTLRGRRQGDYFYPLGMGGKKKKLKRFLTDVKMPLPEKGRVLVLEQEGKVLWIVGSRIDERFRVRPDTKSVLEIRFRRSQ